MTVDKSMCHSTDISCQVLFNMLSFRFVSFNTTTICSSRHVDIATEWQKSLLRSLSVWTNTGSRPIPLRLRTHANSYLSNTVQSSPQEYSSPETMIGLLYSPL